MSSYDLYLVVLQMFIAIVNLILLMSLCDVVSCRVEPCYYGHPWDGAKNDLNTEVTIVTRTNILFCFTTGLYLGLSIVSVEIYF